MPYTLMHKKVLVADIEIDSETSTILRIGKIYNPEHIPIGVEIKAYPKIEFKDDRDGNLFIAKVWR